MVRQHSLLWWIVRILRCITGIHSVKSGSTCRYDLHDYHKRHGGDGTPSHFHVYHCHQCGRPFTI